MRTSRWELLTKFHLVSIVYINGHGLFPLYYRLPLQMAFGLKLWSWKWYICGHVYCWALLVELHIKESMIYRNLFLTPQLPPMDGEKNRIKGHPKPEDGLLVIGLPIKHVGTGLFGYTLVPLQDSWTVSMGMEPRIQMLSKELMPWLGNLLTCSELIYRLRGVSLLFIFRERNTAFWTWPMFYSSYYLLQSLDTSQFTCNHLLECCESHSRVGVRSCKGLQYTFWD